MNEKSSSLSGNLLGNHPNNFNSFESRAHHTYFIHLWFHMRWTSHSCNFVSFQSWNMRSMFGGWQLSASTRPAERRLLWNASWCRRCWLWRCSWGRSWWRFTGKQGPVCPTSPARDLCWDKTCIPSSVLMRWMLGQIGKAILSLSKTQSILGAKLMCKAWNIYLSIGPKIKGLEISGSFWFKKVTNMVLHLSLQLWLQHSKMLEFLSFTEKFKFSSVNGWAWKTFHQWIPVFYNYFIIKTSVWTWVQA